MELKTFKEKGRNDGWLAKMNDKDAGTLVSREKTNSLFPINPLTIKKQQD